MADMIPSLDSTQSSNVFGLIDKITAHGNALSQQQVGAREALIEAARSLIATLETPVEAITWIAWAEPTRNTATRIAINLGLFDRLLENNGEAKSSLELATMVGADPLLVGRVTKHLSAMNMISQTKSNKFEPTALSRAMTVPRYRDGIPFCFDCAGPSFLKLPAYLVAKGYENPGDPTDGPFQYGHNTKLSCREWRSEHPEIQRAFNNHMAGYAQGQPKWMDPGFYPVEERLGPVSNDNSDVLIVDVGGGMGHDMVAFRKMHPALHGSLIVQDLPDVIGQIDRTEEGVESMVHDFLTPQPIKGARAYYMHSVLHDWTDTRCQSILQQLIPVMKRGHSKILINENVVPDVGASWKITSLDWFMMALAASSERTEAQWRSLLESVGLKITGIWTKEPGVQSLIEAVLADDDSHDSV